MVRSFRSWFSQFPFNSRPQTTTSRQRCRLWMETLEDRLTPATFLVVNSADDLLPGSLRFALNQANGAPGSTVEITPDVSGPIQLTRGELPILTDMTLRNLAGKPIVIEQQTPRTRVFHVSGAAQAVTIAGAPNATLVVTGGAVHGGNGGGIYVDTANSTLTLTQVQVVGNTAAPTDSSGQASGGNGGGIYSEGSVSLTASSVLQNRAGAGGGGIAVSQGTVTLSAGSRVSANQARAGVGGGISVASGSVVVRQRSHVDRNSARDVGGIMVGNVAAPGGLAVNVQGGSTVNRNVSSAGSRQNPRNLGGGGIAVIANGGVAINASQVSGNRTVGMYSGGIVVGLGSVTVSNRSSIVGNRNNGPGGGIASNFGGRVTITGASQVSRNVGAALGGGIVNFSGLAGHVQVSGRSQVSNNVLTNGETIGRVIGVFLAVAVGNSSFSDFAASVGGAGGAAMDDGLAQVDAARLRAARPLRTALAQVSHPFGVLVAGGGIAALLTPVIVSQGSQVNGNLCGLNVQGAGRRLIGIGGGIFHVRGPLSIHQSQVSANRAPHGDGGGIWSGGALRIVAGIVSANRAAGLGGGFLNTANAAARIESSVLRNNRAAFGGAIADENDLTVDDSTIAGNTATRDGGGIFYAGGDLSLDDVDFARNTPNNVASR